MSFAVGRDAIRIEVAHQLVAKLARELPREMTPHRLDRHARRDLDGADADLVAVERSDGNVGGVFHPRSNQYSFSAGWSKHGDRSSRGGRA
jgi:hypothetical protein